MNRSRTSLILSQSERSADGPPAPSPRTWLRLAAVASVLAGSLLIPVRETLSAGKTTSTSAETLLVSGAEAYGEPQGVDIGYAPDPDHEVPGGGAGFLARIGHIAGETVGFDDSLTHIGLAPYLFHEESMLFSDLRIYRTNEGRSGGNVGLGLRHYFTNLDSIVGVAGYYDSDDSRGALFHQVGLSLEYLSRWLDVRANWYVPVDDTERVLGTSIVPGSERFEGHFLLFDRRTDFGSAADGGDLTFTTPIPGEIPELINLEFSAGGYHYQSRDADTTKIWGYKLRTDADLFKRILHMFVELTSDRVTDTNVIFGASLNYYHGFENRRRLHDCQFYRMSEWVRRNYTVVTINDFEIDEDEIARNPATGDPYFFAHVRNIPGAPTPPPLPGDQPPFYNFPAPFGDGTVDRPFQFIQEAQAFLQGSVPEVRDNGVIYVHGDSVFTGDDAVVALNDGEIILGEGEADDVIQTLPVEGFSQPATLPIVIPGGSVPQLDAATGTAVTAASDNVFSGFNITSPMGNGILIDTQMGGMFSDIWISDTEDDGILMTGANSGAFRFDRVQIMNAAGVGFHVDGGSAQITVSDPENVTLGNATIVNTVNEALLIENTTGGFVNFAQTIINDDGGAGIRLIDNVANITLGFATMANTTLSVDPDSVGAGLEITGSSGIVTLQETVTITNAAGPGLLVSNLAVGGRVNPIASVTINSRNAVGAEFSNIDGIVQFVPGSALSIGTPGAGVGADDPGIWFHNHSSGSLILDNFTVSGSPSDGVLIGDPTGATVNDQGAVFRVQGLGTISNTTGAAFHVRGAEGAEDPTLVDYRGSLMSNTRIGRGIHIEDTSGLIGIAAAVINNNAATPSPFAALFVDDVSGSITFSSFTANDGLGGVPDVFEPLEFEPVVDIQNVADPASVSFGSINIVDAIGTDALDVDQTNRFTTNTGNINVDLGQAIEIEDTEINVILTSVSSDDSPDFGISVVDSPGSFEITGVGNLLGSGGLISDALLEGALFDGTNEVTINLQDYTGNLVGVRALNMNNDNDILTLDGVQITDNVNQGVFTTDVREVLIEDSLFSQSGLGGGLLGVQQHVLLQVATNPNDDTLSPNADNYEAFIYTIRRNTFADTGVIVGDDAVLIETVGTEADDSRLSLTFNNNLIQPYDRDSAASAITNRPAGLEVIWDGRVGADVFNNTVTMGDGDRQIGFSFITLGNVTRTDINFNNNTITASGATSESLIGANFDLMGPTGLTIDQNNITFLSDNVNNIGLRLRFIDPTTNKNVDITSNNIQMNGGTAISIPLVSAPATFFIQNNLIGSSVGAPDRGLIFGAVSGVIGLAGNVNNEIFVQPTGLVIDPNNIFFIPANSSIGRIIVNGQPVP